MEHALLIRINPKGVAGIFRCKDCEQEGSMGELSRLPCTAMVQTPQGEALIQAIEGDLD